MATEGEVLAAAGSRLAKQGWLTKRGHVRKSWRRRWMVLDPENRLLVYHASNDNLLNPKGTVQLEGAEMLSTDECLKLFQIEHCFGIRTASGKVYYMFAENLGSCKEWMRSIGYLCKGNALVQPESAAPESPTLNQRSTFQALSERVAAAGDAGYTGHTGYGVVKRRARLASFGVAALPHFTSALDADSEPIGETVNLTTRFRRLRDAKSKGSGNELERLKTRVIKHVDNVNELGQAGGYLVVRQASKRIRACPHCDREFNMLTTRKMFCDLCGDVVCARSGCSDPVELSEVAKQMRIDTQRKNLSACVLRVCTKCEKIALNVGAHAQIKSKDASRLEAMYKALKESQAEVDELLPRYNEIMGILTREASKPQHLMQEARRLRADVKSKLDAILVNAGKIEKLPCGEDNLQRKRLQQNIRQAATQWFQARSFKLQSVGLT